MRRLIPALIALFLASPAAAQDRSGEFDHYLLALSWIPAYCAEDGDDRNDRRCRDGSAIGWGVHGLWPQHADGDWPEYCHSPHADPTRQETARQERLFGASGAAWHQWNKHGSCSGLSPSAYYAEVAAAVETVHVPQVFQGVQRALRVDPDVIEAAFIEANPGLTADMMITTCADGDLVELRICLTRDLEPRACAPATTRRECRLDGARLLPLR